MCSIGTTSRFKIAKIVPSRYPLWPPRQPSCFVKKCHFDRCVFQVFLVSTGRNYRIMCQDISCNLQCNMVVCADILCPLYNCFVTTLVEVTHNWGNCLKIIKSLLAGKLIQYNIMLSAHVYFMSHIPVLYHQYRHVDSSLSNP